MRFSSAVELGLQRSFHLAQPVEIDLLALVDGQAHGRGFLLAVLAVVLLRVDTVRPLTFWFRLTHGTRLIGAASARLAMISSTGAVAPELATARSFGLGETFLDPVLFGAAGEVGDGDVGAVEVVHRLHLGQLVVAGAAEHADAGGRIDDEVDHLEPLRRFTQRADGHVDLVGGQHRHLGLVRHRHRHQLHVQERAYSLASSQAGPSQATPLPVVFSFSHGRVLQHAHAQFAGLFDGVDARAGAGRGRGLGEQRGAARRPAPGRPGWREM
jgi:hypothetical protein